MNNIPEADTFRSPVDVMSYLVVQAQSVREGKDKNEAAREVIETLKGLEVRQLIGTSNALEELQTTIAQTIMGKMAEKLMDEL